MNIWPFLLSFILPMLLMMLPMVLSYFKGKSSLVNALKSYDTKVRKFKERIGKKSELKAERSGSRRIEYTLSLEKDSHEKMNVSFKLAERRNYVYWLARLFHRAPSDKMEIVSHLSQPPAAALFIIPKARQKIINKSMEKISEMEPLEIADLNEDFLIVSDRPSAARKFFSGGVIRFLKHLQSDLYYLLIEYSAPHIHLQTDIKKDTSERTSSGMKLVFLLAKRISQVKRPSGEKQITKFLRRRITESLEGGPED